MVLVPVFDAVLSVGEDNRLACSDRNANAAKGVPDRVIVIVVPVPTVLVNQISASTE